MVRPYIVNQKELLKFLNSSLNEYTNAMKKGVTLAEFASKKGINEAKLIHYFAKEQKTIRYRVKKRRNRSTDV